MLLYGVLLSPFVIVLLWYLYRFVSSQSRLKRRAALIRKPLPDEWQRFLSEAYPLYNRLPPDLRLKLHGHINVFVSEKVFLGRNGFEVNDRARVLVAAQACTLILNIPGEYYPGFETILIYPETYVSEVTRQQGYLETRSTESRAGESWHRGPVILAWNQVVRGAQDSRDGYNVVMHEFAHKLDEQNYHMDGLPVLAGRVQAEDWAAILTGAYEDLCEHRDEVIDGYGATSAAEFFAVVTEAFFEKSSQLKQKHPSLYEQFSGFYQLDPASWVQKTI